MLRFLNPPFRPLTTGFYPVGDSITARTYRAAVVNNVGGVLRMAIKRGPTSGAGRG